MAPLLPVALKLAADFGPGIARWLTGSDKAEEVTEKIVGVAQEITGLKDPEAAVAKIKADPNLAMQMQVRLAELDQDLEKAYLADRASARHAEVELAKLGQRSERKNAMVLIDAVGLGATLTAMVVLGLLMAQYPDSISEGVFGALLAQLSTFASYFGLCLRDAHQYEFGSSRGSEMKTLLAQAK